MSTTADLPVGIPTDAATIPNVPTVLLVPAEPVNDNPNPNPNPNEDEEDEDEEDVVLEVTNIHPATTVVAAAQALAAQAQVYRNTHGLHPAATGNQAPSVKQLLAHPRLNFLLHKIFHHGYGHNNLDVILERFLETLKENKQYALQMGQTNMVWDDLITEDLPFHFPTECLTFVYKDRLYLLGPKSENWRISSTTLGLVEIKLKEEEEEKEDHNLDADEDQVHGTEEKKLMNFFRDRSLTLALSFFCSFVE